jgi:hypothetical protein
MLSLSEKLNLDSKGIVGFRENGEIHLLQQYSTWRSVAHFSRQSLTAFESHFNFPDRLMYTRAENILPGESATTIEAEPLLSS